jgi:hypothetical protein
MRNRRKVLLIALFTAAALGVVGVYLYPRNPFFQQRSFASDQWAVGNIRARGQMVHDLMNRKLLEGKTRPEVETFLGAPDLASTNSVEYRVDVGMRIVGSRWTYRLVVHFADEGKVRDILLLD